MVPELGKKVNNKRSRLGFGKGKRKPPYFLHNAAANKAKQFLQQQASNLEHKKTIASLKRAQGQSQYADDDGIEDAGNSFGGKAKKAKNKK